LVAETLTDENEYLAQIKRAKGKKSEGGFSARLKPCPPEEHRKKRDKGIFFDTDALRSFRQGFGCVNFITAILELYAHKQAGAGGILLIS